ncbi:MarR family winged helix-turn-helix transcriptional regulator [Woodsholea maritima]|uniref:MarR family winged helix-turn-helix transcriptional regulator n=1 Tax=Woodsholea maritima TaxID=240237 RepID=UPI0012E9DAA4|nr:MarR family transcriptional regulator [Woodsholea maritima]
MSQTEALFDAIIVLARQRYHLAEKAFGTIGLNHSEARVLKRLSERGGEATQDTLSADLVIDRSNTGRALKRLESAGLITRRKDEGDKRTNWVALTAQGEDKLAAIAGVRQDMIKQVFKDLSEDDAATIMTLLGPSLQANE